MAHKHTINIEDLKRHRRAKKRSKFFKRLTTIMIVVILGFFGYYKRDVWLPFFDGIMTRYSPAAIIQKDGELATGNFPLTIQGGSSYQVRPMDKCFAVIDDTRCHTYSLNGEELTNNQHTYANPGIRTNAKKALIYNVGGKEFKLNSSHKNIYDKISEDNMIFAKIASNDYVAVVTKSDKFLSVMTVYDGTGKEIFKWSSVDSRIIDLTFTPANNGIVVATIGVNGGQFISKLCRFDFDKNEAIWVSNTINTLIISMNTLSDGSITVFGDTKCGSYSKDGQLVYEYTYPNVLKDFASSDYVTAMLVENSELRQHNLILCVDGKTQEVTINEPVKHIKIDKRSVLVMTNTNITEYNLEGNQVSTVEIGNQYDDFYKIDNFIFLLGYSEINRIDFVSK